MKNSYRKVLSLACAVSLLLSGIPFHAYSEEVQIIPEPPAEQENITSETEQEIIIPEEVEIEDVTIQQAIHTNYVIEIPQVLNKTTWTLDEEKEARREQVIRIKTERDIDLYFLLATDTDAEAVISTEENGNRKKFIATDENEIAAIAGESGNHYILKGMHIEAGGSRLIRIKGSAPVKFTLKAMTGSAWKKLTEVPEEEETAETVEEPVLEVEELDKVPTQEPAEEEKKEEPAETEDKEPTEAPEKKEEPVQENPKEIAGEPVDEDQDEPAEEPSDEDQKEIAEETQEESINESAEEEHNNEPAETVDEENTKESAENEESAEEHEEKSADEKQEEIAENPADENQEEPVEKTQEESVQESVEEENNEEPAETVDEENTVYPAENEEASEESDEESADEKQEELVEETQEESVQESVEEENNEEPADEENTENSAEESQKESVQESAEEENSEGPAETVDEENAEDSAEEPDDESADKKQEESDEDPADENQEELAEETQEEPGQEPSEDENSEESAETVDKENAEDSAESEESAEESEDETREEFNEELADEKQEETAEELVDENQEELTEETQEESVQESAEEENSEESAETIDEENTEDPAEESAGETQEDSDEELAEEEQDEVEEESADETQEELTEETQEELEDESAEEAEAELEEDEFWEAVISEHIDDYTVTVTVTKEAEFPIGTTVKITPLNSEEYRNEAAGIFDKNENELGTFLRVFDITFYYEDMEIEPLVPIDVKITFDNAVQLEGENELKLIHLHEEEEAREIAVEAQTTETEVKESESEEEGNAQTITNVESLSFQSGQFSTYIVAEEVVVYTFSQSGQNYEVVLKYNAGANMPEDAVFSVEEITEDSELYEQYRAQVAAVINPEGTVRMPALLDISLKKENGEKIQLGNKVQVIVCLTGDENLTKELKVVHFPGEDPFQGESAVRDAVAESDVHEEIEVLDLESEKLYGRVNTAENTVTFSTDSFSVFALAYTVDFYYGEFEYHMEGSSEMLLSELFAQLGIERSAADVVRAEFTDPSLLQVERTEDDWKLTSLQPFDTVESLTLSFRNGDTILLRVEDSRDAFRVVVNDSNAGTLFSDADSLGKFTDHSFADSFGSTNEENSSPSIYHSFTANAKSGYRFAFWLAVYPDHSTEIIYSNPLPASTQTQAGGTTTFIACFAPQNEKLVIMYAKPENVSDITSSGGVHGVTLPPGQTIRFLCFYTNEENWIEAKPRSGSGAFQGWYNGNMRIPTSSENMYKFSADDAKNLTGLENIFITPVYGEPADSPAMVVNGVFLSKIKFFDVNSTINLQTSGSPMHITGTPAAPTLKKYYYLLAVLKDNAGHELGWAVNPVALNGNAETTTGFYSFHAFEETPGTNGRGSDTNTNTLLYTSGNTVETRLYYSDSELSGADQRTYAYLKQNAVDHPETGYEFGGNFVNDAGENEIHLKAAPPEKKYYVRVYFDEEAETAFNAGDGYYVNVKVSHASSVDSFQGAQLITNLSGLSMDSAGNRYIDFDFTNWTNGSGTTSLGSFTGYESSILVELIHQWQNTYEPNYDTNNAAPIPEGTLAKSYRVHYDTKQTNPKNTATGFYEDRTAEHLWCYDYINLTTISVTNDYDFNTILGPNMSYGIVADHLYQGNDLQTNFAVNHYSAHGHYVSPDLSGTSSGVIVIGEYNVVDGMATNGIGAISYDDVWGRLPIGQVLGNTLIVYADDDTGYNAPEGNVTNIDNKAVIVVHADGENLKRSMVQPGINYGISMSNALMRHPDTFTPPVTSTTSATLDTTGFADGATIYIDGDLYADILKISGGLTIKKRENQTIVFNFDTTKDLEIKQFKVQYLKADETFGPEWTTSTDTANGTDQNKAMDILSRHLVWNLNGVKGKTTLSEAGGIFLQPNCNSEIDISGTSGGWIVSNGFVYNSSAEWHNFYIDMPDTNKLNLRAVKTVDGKIPRNGQKFEFFLDEYDPNVQGSWRNIETVRNTNANVVFSQMSSLEQGWHVFRIHENSTVPTGDGIEAGLYIIDQTTYYAVAHVTKTTDVSGDRYVITPPTYYRGLGDDGHFDSSKFSAENGPEEGTFGAKVTAAAFDNEAVKQGLTIEKKVEGTTDTTRKFTFEVELIDGSGQHLVGPCYYTVTNISEPKTLALENGIGTIVLRNGQKATITGLDVGTQYIITETMVGDTVITAENKDNVDGYDVPDNSVFGTIQSDVSIARFTNVYHATGSARVKARKTLNDHELLENQFKFTLTPLNSADPTVREAYNDVNGNVTFTPDLTFNEADMTGALVLPNGSRTKVLMYYVSESDGTRIDFNYGNVTYDGTKILVITLTDDGKGHITAQSVPGDFTVSFVNNYELKAPGTLGGNKVLTGRNMAAGEFTFTARLYKFTDGDTTETYATNETVEVPSGKYDQKGNPIMKAVSNPDYQTSAHGIPTKLTAKNTAAAENASASFDFPTVYYTDAGTYYYQITENTGMGELPMGVTVKDGSNTVYYAKVVVPEVRTELTESTVTYYSDSACITEITDDAVLFENEQKNISFTVTKSWIGTGGAVKGAGYSIVFSVKKNGKAYPITAEHLQVMSGDNNQVQINDPDGTVTLIGNASGWPTVKIKDVPEAIYVVTETQQNPASGDTETYHISYTIAGGSTSSSSPEITENDTALIINNNAGGRTYGSITVEKKWMAGDTPYTPSTGSVEFEVWAVKREAAGALTTGGIPITVQGGTTPLNGGRVGDVIVIELGGTIGNAEQFFSTLGDGIKAVCKFYANEDASGTCEQKMITPVSPTAGDKSKYSDGSDVTVRYEIPIDVSFAKAVTVEFQNQSFNSPSVSSEYLESYTESEYNTGKIITVSGPVWRGVQTGLPMSQEIPATSWTYYVKEKNANGFTVTYSPAGAQATQSGTVGNGGTITVTNTKDTTMATVTKAWHNADGFTTWPTGVTVEATLYKTINSEKIPVTPAELTSWFSNKTENPVTLSSGTDSAIWNMLPLKDDSNNDITYSVEETAVKYNNAAATATTENGLTTYTVNGKSYDSLSSVSGTTTTITNYERTSIDFEKTWESGIDSTQYTVGVCLNQYVDGASTPNAEFNPADKNKTLPAAGNWTASWNNLPVIDAEGHALSYDVTEVAVYKGSENVTSQFIAVALATGIKNYEATVDVPVTKVWDNVDEPMGATVTAQIYKQERLIVDDGVEVASPTAWTDNYPDLVTGKTVTITKIGDTWSGVASGLPKYRYDGENRDLYEIRYTAKEISVTASDGTTDLTEQYSSATTVDSDGSVTITNTERTGISLNVHKVWNDNNNAAGIRPAAITIQLYSSEDGFATPLVGKDIVLSEANNWRGGWTNLNEQYTYKAQEKTVGGYSVSYVPENGVYTVTGEKNTNNDTVTITNTRTSNPPTGTIELYKIWQDTAGQTVTNNLPSEVRFELNRTQISGSISSGASLTINLVLGYNPSDTNNTGISYSAHVGDTITFTYSDFSFQYATYTGLVNPEIVVAYWDVSNPDYHTYTNLSVNEITSGNDRSVTFTVPDTTKMCVYLRWGADGPEKSEIINHSSFNGGGDVNSDNNTYPMTLTLNEANGWYYKVTGLDNDHNTYTLREIVPSGSKFVLAGYTQNGTNLTISEGIVNVTPGLVIARNTIGVLKLKKLVTLSRETAGETLDGTYEMTLAGAGEATTGINKTITVTVAGGVMTGAAIRNTSETSGTATTLRINSAGYAVIEGLPLGDYTITETNARKNGYNWNPSVTINAVSQTGNAGTVTVAAGQDVVIEVTNDYIPGVVLPATGGAGTLAYTLSGLALITLAGVLLVGRKRKCGR